MIFEDLPATIQGEIAFAVRSAWDSWLSQHDVSVPDIIHLAVKEAVSEWLDRHGEELLRRTDG